MFDILKNFTSELLDEDRCRVWFLKWLFQGGGPHCPRCGFPLQKNRIERFLAGKISFCSSCETKYFPFKGTLFHSSKLSYPDLVLISCLAELGCKTKIIADLIKRQPVAVRTARQKIEEVKQSKCPYSGMA